MPDTLSNIPIPANEWVDLYALSGIAVGERLSIENVGTYDILLDVSLTQPSLVNDSYNILSRKNGIRLQNTRGDLGAWAYCHGVGEINIRADAHTGFIPECSNQTFTNDFYLNVARGLIAGHRIIHKFGSGEVGTTPAPVTSSGFWRTPTSPVALEFVSDSADDATGGTGATKIVIQGIDANWNEVLEEIETNGLTAVSIPTSLLRLHRWYVSESGTYADELNVSHAGTLTVRVAGGGDTWDTINGVLPFAAQSEIGVATIPKGYTAYLLSKNIFTDTSKVADIFLMQRPFADDVIAPFSGARRIIERDIGVSGGYGVNYKTPKGPFVGPIDIGFMANVSVGTANVSVELEILIIQDGF